MVNKRLLFLEFKFMYVKDFGLKQIIKCYREVFFINVNKSMFG